MTDVFISYSRQDDEFAKRLTNALKKQERDVWIDWEDIPRAADWLNEIYAGVESADTFLFIVTQHSLTSEICNYEVAHARKHNKRIVPLIRQRIEGDLEALVKGQWMDTTWEQTARENWQQIGHLNWIFFEDDEKFDVEFAALTETLQTDIEHVNLHTRLLVRAREWESRDKNAGFLLTGDEISSAEDWLQLAEAGSKTPEPTQLHCDYIQQSRAREQAEKRLLRNLRRTTIIAVVIGAIAIIATIASFFLFQLSEVQRAEAERAQALAEDRGNQASSVALAANARNLINDAETGLGLTLAIAAYETYDPPLADVQQTLARAIYGPNALYRLSEHTKSVLDVAFNPDGRTGYSVASDGALIFWDLNSGTMLNEVTFADNLVANNVAVSPDGTQLVVSLFDNSLRLLDATEGSEVATLTGHDDLVMQVVFSPDGSRLLSGGLDRTLRLWDVATGEELQRIDSPGAILNLAFSPDGRLAVTGSGDSILTGSEFQREIDRTVRVWNLRTGSEMQKFTPNSGFVRAVAFSPDGSNVVAGTWNSGDNGRLHLWDITSGDRQNIFFGHTDIITNVAFSPDGQRLLSTSWDRSLRVWDIATSLEIQRFQGHRDRVLSMALSANGEYVLTGTGNAGNDVPDPDIDLAVDQVVWLWDLESRAQIHLLEGHDDWVWGVDISPDSILAASGSGPLRPPALDSSVRIWDVATGEQIRRLGGHTDTVHAVRFSPDGALLASASWDDTVRIWEVASGDRLITYDRHTDNVLGVTFSHDGATIFSASSDKTIHMWDVASGDEIKRFEGHTGAVNSVDLSSDGMQILTASDDRTLRLWDVETGEPIRQFIGHSDRINDAIFSPDGTRLISTSWDTSVREWDVATGEEIRQYIGHNGPVFGVDYSPDGRIAMTASADLTIRLWNTATGLEIRRFEGHTNWILSVLFSPDGNFAVSGAEDNTVRSWRVESTLDGLVAWAHNNRYVPELTCAQRELYNVEPLCQEYTVAS